MKVFSVVGNRPQFIKAAPTSVALRERGIDEVVLHTGQHYDRELSQIFFEELGLEEPRYALDLQTADTEAMQARSPGRCASRSPTGCSSTATRTRPWQAHSRPPPQASRRTRRGGLRSGDLSMPEERNRIEVDRLAQLLFTPDERSREQLASEGVPGRGRGRRRRDGRRRLFAPMARERVALESSARAGRYSCSRSTARRTRARAPGRIVEGIERPSSARLPGPSADARGARRARDRARPHVPDRRRSATSTCRARLAGARRS